MYSLTKSLSLVLDFLVLQTVCSLVFYLANNNGCCVFYRVESLSGLESHFGVFFAYFLSCPLCISLHKHMRKHMHDIHFMVERWKQSL